MVNLTRIVGVALIVLGVAAYLVTDRASATALAPVVPGALIAVLGLLAGTEHRRRTMIHAALVVALLGVLASLMPLMDLPDLLRDEAERPGAVITSAAMALICLVYLGFGVRSFVAARSSGEAP